MNSVAESYGLRVEYGYCDPGSTVYNALQRMDEEVWGYGRYDEWENDNQMSFQYFQNQINNQETFAILAFDKKEHDSDQQQQLPCCLLSVVFLGKSREMIEVPNDQSRRLLLL